MSAAPASTPQASAQRALFDYVKSLGTAKATDEQLAKLRQLLDAAPADKNHLSPEETEQIKKSLIDSGSLKIVINNN